MTEDRVYLKSHGWITFRAEVPRDRLRLWMLFGEAWSKVSHLATVPMRPDKTQELNRLYLGKGALATTAIEGNTLSEDQVDRIMDGSLQLPPSQQYLQQEVENILAELNRISLAIVQDQVLEISPERIREINAQVLANIDVDDYVIPGEYSTSSVVVGNYRAAPREDVSYLVERLCDWLNELLAVARSHPDPSQGFVVLLTAAIVSHIYIAWIHPFDDGNGRTARMLEAQILAQSGVVPWPATNLLSNHYNTTRDRYYKELARASAKSDVIQFVEYAVEGHVDALREQIEIVKAAQIDVAWENYVHGCFGGSSTQAQKRRRDLILDLQGNVVPRSGLRRVSARVAEAYAGKGEKTLTRDINDLRTMGLLELARIPSSGGIARWGYRAKREIMLGFLPLRAHASEDAAESTGD